MLEYQVLFFLFVLDMLLKVVAVVILKVFLLKEQGQVFLSVAFCLEVSAASKLDNLRLEHLEIWMNHLLHVLQNALFFSDILQERDPLNLFLDSLWVLLPDWAFMLVMAGQYGQRLNWNHLMFGSWCDLLRLMLGNDWYIISLYGL